MDQALSQVNSLSQANALENERRYEGNLDLDRLVQQAKDTAKKQKSTATETAIGKETANIISQTATGLGLKGSPAKIPVPKISRSSMIPKAVGVEEPLFADVNAVIDNEKSLASNLTRGGEQLGEKVADVSKVSKFAGPVGALIGGGMALQQDIEGGVKGFKKMNWEDKVGNILTLAGSTAEMAGLVPSVATPFLEAGGAIASLAGGVFSEIGSALDEKHKKAQAQAESVQKQATLQAQKQAPIASTSIGSFGGVGGRQEASFQ